MTDSGLDSIIRKVGLRQIAWEVIRTFYVTNDTRALRIDLASNHDPDHRPVFRCIVVEVTHGHQVVDQAFAGRTIETALRRATQFAARELGMQLPGS